MTDFSRIHRFITRSDEDDIVDISFDDVYDIFGYTTLYNATKAFFSLPKSETDWIETQVPLEGGGRPSRDIKMNAKVLKVWIQSCQTSKGIELRKNALEFAASAARHDAKQSAKRKAAVLETDDDHRANKEANSEPATGQVVIPPFILTASPDVSWLWQIGKFDQAVAMFQSERQSERQRLHEKSLLDKKEALIDKKRDAEIAVIEEKRKADEVQRNHEAKMIVDKKSITTDRQQLVKDREASEMKVTKDKEASELKLAKDKEERDARLESAKRADADRQRLHEAAMATMKASEDEKQRLHAAKMQALHLLAEQTAKSTAESRATEEKAKLQRESEKVAKDGTVQRVSNILSTLLKAYGHSYPPEHMTTLATNKIREAEVKKVTVESVVQELEDSFLRSKLFPVDKTRFVTRSAITAATKKQARTKFFDLLSSQTHLVFHRLEFKVTKLVLVEVFDSLLAGAFENPGGMARYLADRVITMHGTTTSNPACNTWLLWPYIATDTIAEVAAKIMAMASCTEAEAMTLANRVVVNPQFDTYSPIQLMSHLIRRSLGVIGYTDPHTPLLFKE